MLNKAVTINNEGLLLEASLDLPENGQNPLPGVILCHPHPAYGGDMNNNVVMALSWTLTGLGIACLRYNSRGVGRSQGSYGGGEPELTDGRAALSFLLEQEEIDNNRLGFVGYSFGGGIALPLGGESDWIKVIAAVSPVIPPGVLTDCTKPKMIIFGDRDSMIPSKQMKERSEEMSDPKIIKVYPGLDHFWWGNEKTVATVIGEFLMEHIG